MSELRLPAEVMVQISVLEECAATAAARADAVRRITQLGNLRGLNESRLARFGVVSGWVRADSLDKLRVLPFVESLSVNEQRHAL